MGKKIEWPMGTEKVPHFNGPNYDPILDHARLTMQWHRIWAYMFYGKWVSPEELDVEFGIGSASNTSHVRNFRKKRFGYNIVLKKREDNQFFYRLIYNRRGTLKHRNHILRILKIDPESLPHQPSWMDPRYDPKRGVMERTLLKLTYKDLPNAYTGYQSNGEKP
jgi:hypothetical protein